MIKRSVEELNREFFNYWNKWAEGKRLGDLEGSVVISEKGVVSSKYHLPYEMAFSEDKGVYYFTAGVRFSSQGLKETLEKEHEKVDEHLALMVSIRQESPSSRKISNSRYFSKRNIIENGDYVKVKVRLKSRLPDNLNVLFENVIACIIQPTFRGVDKVRNRG